MHIIDAAHGKPYCCRRPICSTSQSRVIRRFSQTDFARELQLAGWDVERSVITKIELRRRCITDYEIGLDVFRSVVVRREPETVGLSSPREATGLFELVPDSQPELLLPFEGTGVDTIWRFELPKAANQFDYSTIADVLLTIEYTALNSLDYRQQVIQTLDPELSPDRPFSFRQQFPDQWYDLNNPDQAATPMAVRFQDRA